MASTILVFLSTYNGEKYLKEQLDSILCQDKVTVKILVRDDGSSDNTMSILENFKSKFPQNIDIVKGKNIGCLKSFHSLITLGATKYYGYDYYAFADQDDVWMHDKLLSGITTLDSVPNEFKLYYCPPQIVDEKLTPLPKKYIKAKGSLAEAFILAPSLGCTMIFNEAVLHKVAFACKNNINCLHDSLTYRLTLALGGSVIEDTLPHILYRQHSSNVVGGMQSVKKRWKRRLHWFLTGDRQKSSVASGILECFKDTIPPAENNILSLLSYYHNSVTKKIKILFSKEFRSNRISHNIMFKVAILFNKI